MVSYFKEQILDLGEMKEGQVKNVKFFTLEGSPKLVRVKPSCGCTEVVINRKTNDFRSKYTASKIPKHIRSDVEFVQKTVKIKAEFEDGHHELLKLEITLNKK